MSPARSATLRPCLAVVLAAVALALAASRVLFCALLRVRRPVVFDGDLAAVERVVLRVVPRLVVRALRLRVAAAFLAAALRFAADVLLVVLVPVVAMVGVSPFSVAFPWIRILVLSPLVPVYQRTYVCKPLSGLCYTAVKIALHRAESGHNLVTSRTCVLALPRPTVAGCSRLSRGVCAVRRTSTAAGQGREGPAARHECRLDGLVGYRDDICGHRAACT